MPKNVIITGASSGIGKSLAFEFARRGFGVGLMARRTAYLDDIRSQLHQQFGNQLTVEIETLDVADCADIAPAIHRLSERLGGFSIMVANAGIANIHRTGVNDFDKEKHVIDVNLVGAMATVDAATTVFRQLGGGTIVGISSISAFVPLPGSGAYSASKAGFSHYLKAAQLELKKKNIHVTIVQPGFIDTDIAEDMHKKPFVVSSEKAASLIVKAVEKKKNSTIIPSFPWRLVSSIVPLLPFSVMSKIKI